MQYMITTQSGATYYAKVTPKGLKVCKSGSDSESMAIALYPDRLPHLEATVKVEVDGHRNIGYNEHGTVTLQFVVSQIRKGMILANRRGMRSTKIVKVVNI